MPSAVALWDLYDIFNSTFPLPSDAAKWPMQDTRHTAMRRSVFKGALQYVEDKMVKPLVPPTPAVATSALMAIAEGAIYPNMTEQQLLTLQYHAKWLLKPIRHIYTFTLPAPHAADRAHYDEIHIYFEPHSIEQASLTSKASGTAIRTVSTKGLACLIHAVRF
jgi:hypothetical protein